jgi:hypothetical protein
MQAAGSASWRFEEGDSQLLHLALFFRDAAGLLVPPSPDVPPPLALRMPGRAEALPSGHRAAAAMQWVTWWRGLVDHELRTARPRGRDRRGGEGAKTGAKATPERWWEVFDPPQFASLKGAPELRSLVAHVHNDAIEWFSRLQFDEARRLEGGGLFPWLVVRNVAEEVAADQGILAGNINGAVHVLDVTGTWSYPAGPGCALCSTTLAADPDSARALLRGVFVSGLEQ